MAERVQEAMEEMVIEVEEMERVGILENFEVKELVKKRKQFEYKVNRLGQNKKKEDYLAYIQYERNLANLIKLRRNKISYRHKEDVIEYRIYKRINKLFSMLTFRWKSDLKLWLSHIDWLKEVKWVNVLSKIFMKALQIHCSEEKLWVAAAKYEFERGDTDTGRQILLRGLRFNPKSKLIHREYIKFELLYVQKLLDRQKVLQIQKKEKSLEDSTDKQEDGDIDMEKNASTENNDSDNEEEESDVEMKDADSGEEENDAASDEEENDAASVEEENEVASDKEENDAASGEEENEVASDEEKNDAASDVEEENEVASDEEEKDADSGEENEVASDEEENEVASDEEENDGASGEEENEVASDEEENDAASDDEKKNEAASDEEEDTDDASGEEEENEAENSSEGDEKEGSKVIDNESKKESDEKRSKSKESSKKKGNVADKVDEKKEDADSVEDKIMNCDLVNLVVKSALDAVEEPEFAVSLLMTARKFPFSVRVQENIIEVLESRFPVHPVTVDTLARMQLEKEDKASELVKNCVAVYKSALTKAPSTQLFHLAVTTLKELGIKLVSCDVLLVNSMLDILELGHQSGHLGLEEYEFYLQLINIQNSSEFEEVLDHVLIKFPTHLLFWKIKLQHNTQVEEIRKTMNGAHRALKDQHDLSNLWQRFMELMTKLNKSEEAYAYLEESSGQLNLAFLRVLYLDRAYEKGIQKAREVYKRFQHQPPFNSDLHNNILTYEKEQPKVDKVRIRKIYEVYSSQFGSQEIQIWLDWISWETRFGHVMEVPNIVCRAESVLKPELVNKFNILRENL